MTISNIVMMLTLKQNKEKERKKKKSGRMYLKKDIGSTCWENWAKGEFQEFFRGNLGHE